MHKKITPERAKEIIDSTDCTILDVRTEDEFVLGHLENSICIPVDDLPSRLDELPDRSATILICCRSGKSSAIAAEYLDGKGYENVYDFGGLLSWRYGYVEWD
ncbi:MAG: rhodanese-like domain-containing protein [Oscillospiraceae bacterium]|nr:rhodanese-like domain-containing protein [Oscillospiraceae bacterium]